MLLAALLLAQTTPAPCTAMDANLPAPLAAWTTPGQGDPGDLTRPVVLLSRTPEDQARLDASPGVSIDVGEAVARAVANPPVAAQTGGVVHIGFRIDKPGTYGIALDQPGWIDVAPRGGAPLASTRHGHGPACSTIRKIVRFELQPGRYELRLSKLTRPQARVMLVTGE